MCSYITEIVEINGSGNGSGGWFPLRHANVYYDHPFHAPLDHALTIDFVNGGLGPSARVAVELSAQSAMGLVEKIRATVGTAEKALGAGYRSSRPTSTEIRPLMLPWTWPSTSTSSTPRRVFPATSWSSLA